MQKCDKLKAAISNTNAAGVYFDRYRSIDYGLQQKDENGALVPCEWGQVIQKMINRKSKQKYFYLKII